MGYSYVQVAMTITGSEKTEDREYRPLEQVRDNYPKFVIARADPIQRRSGIIHENATDLIGQGLDFGARSSWVVAGLAPSSNPKTRHLCQQNCTE